ncbi:MAG TPA: methyltransferase [Terracidiphilus sp.]|nr:methyltransferase [Terracidiphilus sp.]
MVNLLSQEDSLRLRAFFEDAGYTEASLRKHLGAAELPSRQLRNRARLLDRTSAPIRLNILLRWFWLALAQPVALATDLIPGEVLSLLLQSGLLRREGDSLIPRAMLLHIEGFLVVSDHASAIDNKELEMVLWPNPTSKFLARFAVRRHSRATLDLGTGSGILSLGAARYSDVVVATDLNERAVACARFNARFNGVANIEALAGDCFAPVAGRRFDQILSNPPFFITPQGDYLFCENPMELDGLCRRLVKEGPEYLNEGGYMQMLCEWAQIKGQPWEERVAEWLQGTGCDAWVMKGLTQDPEEYAQHRIRETSEDPSQDAASYSGYMSYYRHRGVEAIHDGVIVMRRRDGQNWVRIEEVPSTPKGELGDMILTTFAAHDQMQQTDSDEKLLALRPKLAANARLEQVCVQAGSSWQAESLTLRLTSGFPFHISVQPFVAEFLVTCDGSRTAGEAVQALAANVNAPVENVQRECLAMIRRLIERGFMVA